MVREIDEAWIEEAVERYRQIESRQAEFDRAVQAVEVTVRSPDGVVEIVVNAAGTVTDVRILGAPYARSNADLARSVRAAVTAAADAARWAREKLWSETFGARQPFAGV
ncbi:YbaB/EbfC family nucleoid-associated protein [Solwaraspora sp. WMMD406]|uniref:YbaB/EbfC family nucleoid-associated protein n=1 Tax=Solwaraspora sp. WMMD406 TaxID=3016095 RepID=UPI002415AB44|nr:YbaB/EbfC family nucleoid-associated protein [Solwaraspora sp. WMMD406]MDG4763405.1 YbaB/EbfC family nucleoid-associated protein [Solwaraspora sp. WMMD406]